MAKKKTTKAKKRTPKKATKKNSAKKTPKYPQPIGLQAKIRQIMEAVTIIECTGEEYDEKTGETCYYTEAAEVFRVYTEQFIRVGLTFVPVGIETVLDNRAYKATMTYRLTDTETGQYQDVVAVGLGCNGVWALNSAQTVARKQALLNTFGASYPQPKTAAQVVRKAVNMFQPFDVLSPGEAAKEMSEFFSQENQNGTGESRESVRSPKRPAKSDTGKHNKAKAGRRKAAKTD